MCAARPRSVHPKLRTRNSLSREEPWPTYGRDPQRTRVRRSGTGRRSDRSGGSIRRTSSSFHPQWRTATSTSAPSGGTSTRSTRRVGASVEEAGEALLARLSDAGAPRRLSVLFVTAPVRPPRTRRTRVRRRTGCDHRARALAVRRRGRRDIAARRGEAFVLRFVGRDLLRAERAHGAGAVDIPRERVDHELARVRLRDGIRRVRRRPRVRPRRADGKLRWQAASFSRFGRREYFYATPTSPMVASTSAMPTGRCTRSARSRAGSSGRGAPGHTSTPRPRPGTR